MYAYYKIPPDVAKEHNLTDTSPRHPDGWYLITPPKARIIAQSLPVKDDLSLWGVEEAVLAVGGVIYNSSQAMASARGEKEYMMNVPSATTEDQNTSDVINPSEGSAESDLAPEPSSVGEVQEGGNV